MPRKTKLTKDLIKEAERLLRAGNYTVTVCQFLGISERTWYNWLNEGEKDLEAGKNNLKVQFFQSVKKAESTSEIRNVQVVQNAAQEGDWKAAMTYLERKFPDRWGRREKVSADVSHSGEVVDRHEQHTVIEVKHELKKYESAIDELLQEGYDDALSPNYKDE